MTTLGCAGWGDSDLIAYLEERRKRNVRIVLYGLGSLACAALAVLAVTAILHAAGVGEHTTSTVNITSSGFSVTRHRSGAVAILP